VSSNLADGATQIWKISREIYNDLDIVKYFESDNNENPAIIVTASRVTGVTSYSFEGDFSGLANADEIGRGLASDLLDFVRRGSTIEADGTLTPNAPTNATVSLASARSQPNNGAVPMVPILTHDADGNIVFGGSRYRPVGTDNNGGFRLHNVADNWQMDVKIVNGKAVEIKRFVSSGGVEVVKIPGESTK
jgi:hypothetical protein